MATQSQERDRSFLTASISDLVAKLRIDEKIRLLGAPNWWNTHDIPRLHIPSIRMSDGPNGVRGSSHLISTPAQCLPCETSMASTFNPDLVHKVGEFLAEEAKVKSAVILLAPTCNIQRSPLGGRSFESFSEDPHLSGTLAAAYVNGLQSKGVSATIKHFVVNDQEHERTAVDSVVGDRALREIYLYPFMLAQKHAKPWAFMTAYNRLNGVHCSEDSFLLNDILRKEWGFEGLVMSDWYGTYSTDLALNAGLDLEMPGPPRWRNPVLVNHMLSSQKTSFDTISDRAETLLTFAQKLTQANPEVVYGDGVERSRDSPEARAFCRALAAEGMVLLKNERGVLPLTSNRVKKLAVIGPGAKARVISGGGSAALAPTYVITPYEGLVSNADTDIEIKYAVGCYNHRFLPLLNQDIKTPSGEPGWEATFLAHDGEGKPTIEVEKMVLPQTQVRLNDFLPAGLTDEWSMKLKGSIKFTKDIPFEFGLCVAGRAKLYIDGNLVIDNWTRQRPGAVFYGQGTAEEKGTISVTAGQTVEVYVEYTNTSPPDDDEDFEKKNSQPGLIKGLRLGGAEKIDPDKAIHDAVELARSSDAVVIVVGLAPEWESEGFDRASLDLPGRQDELVSRVAKANPRTVVCIQAGSAVSMPWVADVSGLLQCWYAGNETGNALADVVYGNVNPSGRLPLTLPVKIEDVPSYLNFGSENGQVHYREDLFVGYKHYQARKVQPLFPFGFGLSYTQFSITELTISTPSETTTDISVTVTVKITNTGSVVGAQVAQLYVSLPPIGVTTPALQLRSFAKTKLLEPGKTELLTMTLDKYAVSFWDTPKSAWKVKAGRYGVHVGSNSVELLLKGEFELKKSFEWTGL